ncbi:hypothetical protein SCLCIDRAFT_109860, partial [Scleroderma citrinum Foug A]
LPESMKQWTSPVYAFFEKQPSVTLIQGHHAHEFKCSRHGCNATICRFTDKKDARSIGNMCRHIKACWEEDALCTADSTKDYDEVYEKIMSGILQNSTITTAFECKADSKVMYLTVPHTLSEIR